MSNDSQMRKDLHDLLNQLTVFQGGLRFLSRELKEPVYLEKLEKMNNAFKKTVDLAKSIQSHVKAESGEMIKGEVSIFYLCYMSECLVDKEKIITECEKILYSSQKNNIEYDITGMLALRGNLFIQLLEGDRDHVLNLYQKISKDKRHQHVHILSEGFMPKRSFPEWSMKYVITGPQNEDQISSFLTEDFRLHPRALSHSETLALLTFFHHFKG